MKTISRALCAVVALLALSLSASAQTSTVSLSVSGCTFYNASGSTVTATNGPATRMVCNNAPQVELAGSANGDIVRNSASVYRLYAPTNNYSTKTFTITAPAGYIIQGYSVGFASLRYGTFTYTYYSFTVTPSEGGSAVTSNNGRNNYSTNVTMSATNINKASTSFTLGVSAYRSGYNYIAPTISVTLLKIASPTFSPAAGEVDYGTEVTVTAPATPSSGYSLEYSVNGGTAVTASSPVTLTLTEDAAIRARSVFNDGTTNVYSDYATANYTVAALPTEVAAPSFSLPSGNVEYGATTVISSETRGATIHYSTDGGTTWTTGASPVSVPLTATATVEAYATVGAGENTVTSETVTASYTLSGAAPITQTLFDGPNSPVSGTNTTYRIPAIVKCANGDLLAVCDRRYNLSDVGCSGAQMELVYRYSSDGGATWSAEQTIATKSSSTSDWKYAMGDAAVVADRESGNVLVYCAAGNVSFANSTSSSRIKVGCFRSTDNGHTWNGGTDVTSQMYNILSGAGTVNALFITSGHMFQSRYIKTGSYYRIYAAFPVKFASAVDGSASGTQVIYSDDFGQTWSVLGSASVWPSKTSGYTMCEEAKIEELPDGSVMLMVRDDNGATSTANGHRVVNVFAYTNSASGTGYWQATATSGITGMTNACNFGLVIVPAQRTADGAQTYLALATIPFHNSNGARATDNYGRRKLGIYYKELADGADYVTTASLADGWTRGLQLTDLFSAYAEGLLLDNGQVALLYEDNGKHGSGKDASGGTNANTEAYDIVFRTLTLSQITGGAYVADLSFTDRTGYFDSSLAERTEAGTGKAVGMLSSGFEGMDYVSDKTQENMEEVLEAYVEGTLPRIPLYPDRPYTVRNVNTSFGGEAKGTTLLGTSDDRTTLKPYAKEVESATLGDFWAFQSTGTDGVYKLCNLNNELWSQHTLETGVTVLATDDKSSAEDFVVTSYSDGWSCMVSQNPTTEGQGGLNCAGHYEIVGWKYAKDVNYASYWYLEPVETWSIRMNKVSAAATESWSTVYLPFSVKMPEGAVAYTITDVEGKTANTVSHTEVPAYTPFVLKSTTGASVVDLIVPDEQYEALQGTNLLGGFLRDTPRPTEGTTMVFGVVNGEVGFYVAGSSITTITGNKAYLPLAEEVAVRGFELNFDNSEEVTGLDKGALVERSAESGHSEYLYDLQGRRVANTRNLPHGVYICNGKKIYR